MVRIEREDTGQKGRFVIYEDDEMAGEMTYVWAGNRKFIINHTRVDEKFGRRGLGKQLVMKAVEFAREDDIKILPLCPFAKRIFDRDETIQDVKY
ncbi:MAG: GNAT family N-acetyltransferase [Mangrovibacterium sp.]